MKKRIIRYYKPNIIDLLILILTVLMFFMGILKTHNYMFSYADELLELIIILLAIPRLVKKKSKYDLAIISLILLLNIIGFLGSIIYKYNYHYFSIFIDLLAYQKFFTVYICSKLIFSNKKIDKYYSYMKILSKLFVVFGIFIYIIMYIKPSLLSFQISIKNGFKIFQIGGHPSYTCALYALITSILLYERRNNRVWIILSLLLCILTMRSKAFGFAAFIFYLIFFTKKRLTLKKMITMIIPAFIVAYDDIYFYFIENANASRIRLLRTSLKIAKDHLPIGSGFASYGTAMSTRYNYSYVYDKYGLSNSWGYSRDANGWVGDGGWASIIGQFGFLGLVLVILLIYYILKDFNLKKILKSKNLYLPIFGILGYLLISSTNETFFASDFSVLYAISLAIFYNISKNCNEMELIS